MSKQGGWGVAWPLHSGGKVAEFVWDQLPELPVVCPALTQGNKEAESFMQVLYAACRLLTAVPLLLSTNYPLRPISSAQKVVSIHFVTERVNTWGKKAPFCCLILFLPVHAS